MRKLQVMSSGSCLAFILAGGRGSRLHELTMDECKPALSFAGSSRIIDFVLANLVNSGLQRAFVATQYRPARLLSHIRTRWYARFLAAGGSIDILSSGSEREEDGFKGTADAVFRNIAEIDRHQPRHVLVLAADHVYQMDYSSLIAAHVSAGADVTIAADVVPCDTAHGFGVISATSAGRIVDFVEKPAEPPAMPDRPGFALASMGIYVFDWPLLREALIEDAADGTSSHDFGRDLLPRMIARGNAFAHRFVSPSKDRPGYWRDVGTLDALHEANMDLLAGPGANHLDLDAWPLHVGWMGNPFYRSNAGCSLVYPGSEPFAAAVRQSIVGPLVSIGAGARLNRAVLMPGVVLCGQVRLADTIVAPGVRVSTPLVVGDDAEEDARWFRRSAKGVVLITQEMLARRDQSRRLVRGWTGGVAAGTAVRHAPVR